MVRAVRGAIKVSGNDTFADGVNKLISALQQKNGISESDLISIVFSQTKDITANPATALRGFGYAETPLFCTQEPEYEGTEPGLLRVLLTFETKNPKSVPVYLDGAEKLRKDLT